MSSKRKVFGIGFQKTGTTSLGKIFAALDYRTSGYHDFRDFAQNDSVDWQDVVDRALRIAEQVDATKDTPWPLLYQELDAAFPGSRFIHVTRNPDAWIKSAVKDFAEHANPLHQAIYGCPAPLGNEDIWLARYNRHNDDVAAYFADRPDDYLHLRLEDGVSYEKVCDFLGEPHVGKGVPIANTRTRKRLKTLWWRLFNKT